MDQFIGQIIMFGGNFAPRSWAFCHGQLLSIAENSALFSILGTTYGGDGRTTFGLPDLRGRSPISPGNGPGLPAYNLGQKVGTPTTTLTVANLPAAQIRIPASGDDATSDEPSGKSMATSNSNIYAATGSESMANGSIQGAANQPYNNMQPSLAVNYIIALQGIFPPRS